MPDKKPVQNQNNEIDLLQLFKSFGDFIIRIFRGFFDIILRVIIFSIKKWMYLLVSMMLAVCFALLTPKVLKNDFSSDLVLRSNTVPNQEMISYISRLDEMTESDNIDILAKSLNISPEESKKIKSIKPYWFVDLNNDQIIDQIEFDYKILKDTSISMIPYKLGIRAKVTDPGIFIEIEKGIDYYINSNAYFVKKNELRLENLQEYIDQVGIEFSKLDSLQKKEYYVDDNQLDMREGQIIFNNELSTPLRHKDLLNLLGNRQNSQMDLSINSGIITIFEEFTAMKTAGNSLSYFKLYILLFSGLGYLIALLFHFKKKILKLIR